MVHVGLSWRRSVTNGECRQLDGASPPILIGGEAEMVVSQPLRCANQRLLATTHESVPINDATKFEHLDWVSDDVLARDLADRVDTEKGHVSMQLGFQDMCGHGNPRQASNCCSVKERPAYEDKLRP